MQYNGQAARVRNTSTNLGRERPWEAATTEAKVLHTMKKCDSQLMRWVFEWRRHRHGLQRQVHWPSLLLPILINGCNLNAGDL